MEWLTENNNLIALLLFGVLYVATFKLAWRLLRRLVTGQMTRTQRLTSPMFWVEFVAYRVVIAAPYIAFLVVGAKVPTSVKQLVIGWLVLGFILGLLRFVGTDRTVKGLWWLYGHFYDGLRGFYPYQNLVNRVVDRMHLRDGMKVLELGCGTGNVIDRMREVADVTVVGVDGSSTMLSRAQRKLSRDIASGKVLLCQDDLLRRLKAQPEASYDRVALVNVLYAVVDRAEVWRECQRVLKPGGRIVATTSDRGGSVPIIKEHLQFAPWWKLLHPRLIAVAIIDYFISGLAETGTFAYPSKEDILREVRSEGGRISGRVERVYGGDAQGVNILFDVTLRDVGRGP